MPTPFPSHIAAPTRSNGLGHRITSNSQWRCTECGKLLGVRREGQMHIRSSRGPEYLTGFPVTSACSCGTLNRAFAAA